MVKVLSTGDDPLISTGYGQVWDNLLRRWCKEKPDWEFYHIGWQNQDRAHKTVEGYTMLPMGKYEYGYDAVAEQLMKLQPDVLLTLADVGWQSGYTNVVAEAKKAGWRGIWIAYTPLDTEGWAMTWDEVFKDPDINIAMAGFGQKQFEAHGVKSQCIPHGVDTVTFKPLPNREELKSKYGVGGKFVVGFVGRNQRRKQIDRLLQTFSNFVGKDKEDVILMAHTDEEPPKDGWSIPYCAWQYKNIEGKVKLTKSKMDIPARQKIGPENMNEIYNMMDVFLYTTGGEFLY
jgi:glycosyltransferase involved in cell wall biosynthesis